MGKLLFGGILLGIEGFFWNAARRIFRQARFREALLYQEMTHRVVLLCILTGCAHYTLPEGRLDSPETRGQTGLGRLELLRIEPSTNLTAAPSPARTDPETGVLGKPAMKRNLAHPSASFSAGLGEGWDAGITLHPSAPFALRAKRQLSGLSEPQAAQGNFSTALTGGAGILLGSSSGNSVVYWLADFAFLAGYRIWERHLFSIAPSVTLASLSGPTLPVEVGATSGIGGDSASATSFGAALGYQYNLEGMRLRSEISWKTGSFGQAKLGGFGMAGSFGLAF